MKYKIEEREENRVLRRLSDDWVSRFDEIELAYSKIYVYYKKKLVQVLFKEEDEIINREEYSELVHESEVWN
jgi:hypothetical protein